MNPNGRPVKLITDHGFYNSGGIHKTRVNGKKTKACQLWENIRSRIQTLPKLNESKFGKYTTVTVDEGWKDFQMFASWFETIEVIPGWVLDKDLLGGHYGPNTCVFLPDEVNKALSIKPRVRGELPVGVTRHTQNSGRVNIKYDCKHPDYYFTKCVPESAMVESWHNLYKPAREGYIRHLAEKYKDLLDPRAYNALCEYVINVED